MFQGNNRVIEVDILEGEISQSSNLVWVVKRLEADSDTALITKRVGEGITISSPKKFTIQLTPSDTEDMYGKFFHEAKLIDLQISVFAGRVTVYRTLHQQEGGDNDVQG